MNKLYIVGMVVACCLFGAGHVWGGGARHAQSASPAAESSAVLSMARVERALLQELRSRVDSKDITITLQVVYPKKPVSVPPGATQLAVAQDRFGNLTGRRAFRVHVKAGSRVVKTISVVALVKARREVVIPVRWIKANEVLGTDDVTTQTISLRTLDQKVVVDPHTVVGKQSTRSLPPRQPIRSAYLTEPPLVHKGDRVMIEVRRGGMFIQTIGVAKAHGQRGERIPVKNQQSGREVLATVISEGNVEVRF